MSAACSSALKHCGAPAAAAAAAARPRLTFPTLSPTAPPLPAALLPVLKAIPTCRVTGCDISPTALRLLRRAAEQAGVEAQRTHTFVLDASSSSSSVDGCGTSSGGSGSPMAGLAADALLLVFTLSALAPTKQPAVLAHAYAALSPGGLLLFRWVGGWVGR